MLTTWSEIKISGKESYPEQGLLPCYSGMKWVSSRILFVHSGSKAAANNDLSSTFGCSTTGMMQDNHLLQLGVTWDIYLWELLCHCGEVLSGMRTLFSESVVFHLVFWASSFVVLVWVVLVFGFVLLRLWKTLGFLLFTCSRTT